MSDRTSSRMLAEAIRMYASICQLNARWNLRLDVRYRMSGGLTNARLFCPFNIWHTVHTCVHEFVFYCSVLFFQLLSYTARLCVFLLLFLSKSWSTTNIINTLDAYKQSCVSMCVKLPMSDRLAKNISLPKTCRTVFGHDTSHLWTNVTWKKVGWISKWLAVFVHYCLVGLRPSCSAVAEHLLVSLFMIVLSIPWVCASAEWSSNGPALVWNVTPTSVCIMYDYGYGCPMFSDLAMSTTVALQITMHRRFVTDHRSTARGPCSLPNSKGSWTGSCAVSPPIHLLLVRLFCCRPSCPSCGDPWFESMFFSIFSTWDGHSRSSWAISWWQCRRWANKDLENSTSGMEFIQQKTL